jgi:aminoglycoside phosphotransferase (APT) family kinase protein
VDELLRLAPSGLRRALAEREAEVEQAWREGPRVYLRAGVLFARFSEAEADVPVLEHEARVRALVGEEGALRSPAVFAQGRGWLVERRIVPDAAPVQTVVAAARELAGLELPGPPLEPRRRRSLAPLRRRLRLAGRPRFAAELARARRLLASSRLQQATSHGDFHPGNVLRAEGAAWVIDWELLGQAPLGYDLMRYRATLSDPDERLRIDAGALELAGDELELARLRYAVAVLTAADKLSHPQQLNRDETGAAALLAELPELRSAARLGRPRTGRAGARPE